MKHSSTTLEDVLLRHDKEFAKVVPFEASDRLLLMDFTAGNIELTNEILMDTNVFIQYINKKLKDAEAKYGIGGYGENRVVYRRSEIFGPSPAAISILDDGAKAPSRWEADEECLSVVQEETIGYRHADPFLYGMLKEYALKNRSQPTEAEAFLWQKLNTKQLGGFKFRRQHIIDKFIADFLCLKKRLVIEVDGLIHQLPENKLSDEERNMALNKLGFSVLRFTNDEVLHDIDNTLKTILKILEATTVELPSLKHENLKTEDTIPANGSLTANNNESLESKRNAVASPPPGDLGGRERRTLHLGIDIWGAPHTKVITPLNGIVHSFAFNNALGDYGATIILTHNLEGVSFHTLYGHLSLNSIKNLAEGDVVKKGDVIAEFGIPFENGQWPPHLHFQVIKDMQGMKGDYPGVCALSEKEKYLKNCPDADLILGMMKYAKTL